MTSVINAQRRAVVPALVVALVSAAPTAAWAQTADLEEIIVTSQKREQNLLTVPATISVFSASDIEKTGALTLSEIQDFVPGMEVGDGATQAGITIRGVSSANISTGGDPSVATFYDEVYLPRAALQMAFSDLARVEVLKGPQGTLYGRNAAAGVVNMIPNAPAAENEGFVRARVGNYSLMRLEAMGNVALSENFFVRANLLSNERDGYLSNVTGGRDPGSQKNFVARLAARWKVTDSTQAQLSYDHDDVDNAPRGAVGVSPWAECPSDPFCGRVRNDVIAGEETRDMYAVTGKVWHDFNDEWSMKFITSCRTFEVINRQDEDGTAEIDRYLDTDNIEDSDIQYNELQFNFDASRVHLVFGANYQTENTSQVIPVNLNADSAMRAVTAGIAADLGAPLDHIWNPAEMAFLMSALTMMPITPDDIVNTGDFFYDTLDGFLPGVPVVGPSLAGSDWSEIYYNEGDFTNWGVYGDIDYRLNDRWNFLLGLRYSYDDKSFSWRNPPNTLNAVRPGTDDIVFLVIPGYEEARTGTLTASNSWDKVTGRAVANYQISKSALTFVSYSTGYKAGGFDSLDITSSDNPLQPEESTNLEWGIKGDFAGSRLRMKLAVFDFEINGRQRTVDTRPPGQPNAIPRVINGDQEIFGAEVVFSWLVTETLQFGALTTWREEESVWEPFYNAVGELVDERTKTNANTDYTIMADWFPQLPKGNLALRLEYIFNENTTDDQPGIVDPTLPGLGKDRKLLNARVAWTSDNDALTVGIWGKNLLDEQVVTGVNDISTGSFGTPFVTIDPPLTWGMELAYQF